MAKFFQIALYSFCTICLCSGIFGIPRAFYGAELPRIFSRMERLSENQAPVLLNRKPYQEDFNAMYNYDYKEGDPLNLLLDDVLSQEAQESQSDNFQEDQNDNSLFYPSYSLQHFAPDNNYPQAFEEYLKEYQQDLVNNNMERRIQETKTKGQDDTKNPLSTTTTTTTTVQPSTESYQMTEDSLASIPPVTLDKGQKEYAMLRPASDNHGSFNHWLESVAKAIFEDNGHKRKTRVGVKQTQGDLLEKQLKEMKSKQAGN